jgi:hypothetical protein
MESLWNSNTEEEEASKSRKRTKVGKTLGDLSSIWATLFNKLSIFLFKFTSSIFQLTIYRSLRKMDQRIEIFMPKFIVHIYRTFHFGLNCRLILAFGQISHSSLERSLHATLYSVLLALYLVLLSLSLTRCFYRYTWCFYHYTRCFSAFSIILGVLSLYSVLLSLYLVLLSLYSVLLSLYSVLLSLYLVIGIMRKQCCCDFWFSILRCNNQSNENVGSERNCTSRVQNRRLPGQPGIFSVLCERNSNIRQAFVGRDATTWKIYFWGSSIPTNESLFILLALPTLTQTVHSNIVLFRVAQEDAIIKNSKWLDSRQSAV